MRITAIEPQQRSTERVNLYVDGEFRCGAAMEVVLGAGLRVGDVVAPETLERLEREDHLWKAREAALNLLSYRARTRQELARRLGRKGFEPDVVETVLAKLEHVGFIDDEAFAASFVRDRVRFKPRGSRRLVQELRAKGVAGTVAESVVDEVLDAEELTETELARDAARGWSRRLARGRDILDAAAEDTHEVRRRLYGFLARRGFGSDAIRTVTDEVLRGDLD